MATTAVHRDEGDLAGLPDAPPSTPPSHVVSRGVYTKLHSPNNHIPGSEKARHMLPLEQPHDTQVKLPMPILRSCSPSSGSTGTMITVILSVPLELEAASLNFFLKFGRHRVQGLASPTVSDGLGSFFYAVGGQAPSHHLTGAEGASVNLTLVITMSTEDTALVMMDLGSFTFNSTRSHGHLAKHTPVSPGSPPPQRDTLLRPCGMELAHEKPAMSHPGVLWNSFSPRQSLQQHGTPSRAPYGSILHSRSPGPHSATLVRSNLTTSPTPAFTSTSVFRTPQLVRTSTLQAHQPAISGTHSSPHVPYSKRAVLVIQGDLDSMARGWTSAEWVQKRRIVVFRKRQHGSTLMTEFRPADVSEKLPDSICVSCIYWQDKDECFVTRVDMIKLLEALVAAPSRFTVEEKNRIRRSLEGYRPRTVSRAKPDSQDFHTLIMAFPPPKPRNIDKDVAVFPWKILSDALKMVISKYSVPPTMTSSEAGPKPMLLTPTSNASPQLYQTSRATHTAPSAPSPKSRPRTPDPFSISSSRSEAAFHSLEDIPQPHKTNRESTPPVYAHGGQHLSRTSPEAPVLHLKPALHTPSSNPQPQGGPTTPPPHHHKLARKSLITDDRSLAGLAICRERPSPEPLDAEQEESPATPGADSTAVHACSAIGALESTDDDDTVMSFLPFSTGLGELVLPTNHPFNAMIPQLVRLATEQYMAHRGRPAGPSGHASQAARQSSGSGERGGGARSSLRRGKRKHHGGDGSSDKADDDDDDENNGKRPCPSGPPANVGGSLAGATGPPLACPFYKHDKLRHERCLYLQLRRIKDVKQHLRRTHTQPRFCPVCGAVFPAAAPAAAGAAPGPSARQELDAHIIARGCVQRDFGQPEGVTEEHREKFMQRVSRSLSLSEQWFTLWDILFPGLPRPESAFVQGPVAEVCSEVVRWWDRYGRTVVAEHIEANGGSDEFERRVRNYESDLTALFVTVGRGLLVGVIGQMRSGSPDEERAVTTQTTTRSLYPSDSVGALRTSPESDRETQRTAPSTPATGDEADQNEPAPASKPGATAEVEHEVRPENEKLPPGENEMMSSRTQPSLDDINAWAEYAHDSRMVAADSFEWWNDVGGESYGMPTWM